MTDRSSTPPSSMPPRHQGRIWALTAVLGVVIAAALVGAGLAHGGNGSARSTATSAPENYGSAPSYQLMDQSNRRVSSSQFAGKVQVVSFLFPYCTNYCPLLARDMARLATTVADGPLHGRVQLVSFNVDPSGAGPIQLRKFMRQYGGRPADASWEYLTGTPQQIRDVVAGGFHLYYSKTSLAAEHRETVREKAAGTYRPQPAQPNALAAHAHVDYDVVHNDYVEIISPKGEIVAIFDQASRLTHEQLVEAVGDALAGRAIPPQPVG